MKTRKLGKNGPQIATVGLGCMGMSDFYGAAEDKTSIDVIHHALDIGVNFFDTADMYGSGENEKLLGRALADRRDRAIVATKFAIVRDDKGGFVGISGKPEYVKQACDASLKRLGIDVIDLYYQHRVDKSVPIEETVGAMKDLVTAGKVRFIGLSEAKPETIRRATKVHPISALQTEYSLWSPSPKATFSRPVPSSGSPSSPTRRSAAAFSPARSSRSTIWRRTTGAASCRASPPRTSPRTWSSSAASNSSRRRVR